MRGARFCRGANPTFFRNSCHEDNKRPTGMRFCEDSTDFAEIYKNDENVFTNLWHC